MTKISIIIPVYNVNQKRFKNTLDSLVKQTNKSFEVCISDGGQESFVDKVINRYKKKLNIHYSKSQERLGISDNTNNALKLASGDYISFLDHDDLLMPTAIDDIIVATKRTNADVIYTDEQIVDEQGIILNRFFKPDFSMDLLYSQNYICHFLAVRKEIVDKVGLFNSLFDGAQDYDYILRVSENTKNIYHLPKILYSWLSTPDSTSTNSNSKPYAQEAGLKALDSHLKRVYGSGVRAEETDYLFVYQPKFDLLKNKKVDIIIPMKDKWVLSKLCIESILEKTKNVNYQITILDNNSEEELTFKWFDEVKKLDKRIRILKAKFSFNWSKLQNYGIKNSDADVFVFLNNDTVITDEYWLDILCNNALREEVGVVGPLLLYEDGTIQHGGVVIGMNGYADHVFKGMKPIHANINYTSPMVTRNVLAVTGACMAISRDTINKIGLFNEKFIICGSDIEICLRAYKTGLRNLYLPTIKLIHLESKSRDSYIPPIDFKLSEKHYKEYWKNGDPFYNKNLDYDSCVPKPKDRKSKLRVNKTKISKKEKIKNVLRKSKVLVKSYHKTRSILKKNPLAVKIYRKIKHIEGPYKETIENGRIVVDYTIPEIKTINPVKSKISTKYRINILIPSLNKEKVFGGIATAMKFFNQFNDENYSKRIIITDTPINDEDLDSYAKYQVLNNDELSTRKYQVVNISDQENCNLAVAEKDIFIATAWWTAYSIKPVIEWQKKTFNSKKCNSLIYFIQDYEPFFYPWSSRQCSAESTYRFNIPTIAVFNSLELKQFFDNHGYKFKKSYYFSPILNDKLKEHLIKDKPLPRKKQIIVYGRPSVPRNAFEIIEESLMKVFKDRKDACQWKFISMGEDHYEAKIKDGVTLKSVGKLTLAEYAKYMEESYMGISLMVSPHPSYPPLEMSSFGVKTITNKYENKDISYFNENIISVDYCDSEHIAKEIKKLVDNFDKNVKNSKKIINKDYINSSDQFKKIINDIIRIEK